MWTINQVDTESGAYNIPAAVRFTGALDVSAFAAAMADVIERHEVLRTRYPDSADGPIQLIGTVADALPDLRPVPVTEAEVYQRVGEVLRGGFDVTSEVPVRAGLFQLDETDHVFALVAHHITADGFSMRPLIRDVMLAYTSRAAGDAPQWAPLPVQYADFSLWQREVLGSEDDPDSALSSQLEFWTQELSGLPDLLPLRPTDRVRRGSRPSVRHTSSRWGRRSRRGWTRLHANTTRRSSWSFTVLSRCCSPGSAVPTTSRSGLRRRVVARKRSTIWSGCSSTPWYCALASRAV
ncbi:hypothetical protein BJF84_27130 [Rhodococcus sp. CUA-806]|nr:hypothetical protein BJF84_27130 [Rhodococcus sp. CUA-806]